MPRSVLRVPGPGIGPGSECGDACGGVLVLLVHRNKQIAKRRRSSGGFLPRHPPEIEPGSRPLRGRIVHQADGPISETLNRDPSLSRPAQNIR
jgi:hypothetical protein